MKNHINPSTDGTVEYSKAFSTINVISIRLKMDDLRKVIGILTEYCL